MNDQATLSLYVWGPVSSCAPNERGTAESRTEDHELEAREGVQPAKCDIIRGIWAQGVEVQKSVVYGADSEEALRYEVELLRIERTMSNDYRPEYDESAT